MTKQPDKNKIATLQKQGSLNPFPHKVQNQLFRDSEFFDPYDIVQVKYELLRKVQVENDSIINASKAFGFSRLSFYRTLATFEKFGLFGLIPQKRGPRNAHKLTDTVVEFINKKIQDDPSITSSTLKRLIEEEFALSVHVRSIERALIKKKITK